MHTDIQILFKRINILFFAVYSPCGISSIVLLVRHYVLLMCHILFVNLLAMKPTHKI